MNTVSATLINGTESRYIDVMDRGLNYGDGLFETMMWSGNTSLLWPYHYERLKRGGEILNIPVPTQGLLESEISQLTHGVDNGAIVKIILTRGMATRGYAYSADIESNRIVQVFKQSTIHADYSHDGVSTYMCQLKLSSQPRLAGVKHLNRLEQILARAEQSTETYPEGLLCDQHDNIIEAISHNIFLVESGKLVTPRLDACGVAGIMRQIILEQAANWGITVSQEIIPKNRLTHADEVFLCNSIQGIWPVRSIDNLKLRVGPMTKQISVNVQKWLV